MEPTEKQKAYLAKLSEVQQANKPHWTRDRGEWPCASCACTYCGMCPSCAADVILAEEATARVLEKLQTFPRPLVFDAEGNQVQAVLVSDLQKYHEILEYIEKTS